MLRENQIEAINTSTSNDFSNGIHYHATGTGKSYIAMYILKEFNQKYKNKNVIWLCERKSILTEQFSKKIIKERNFSDILNNFIILDFTNYKNNEWYNSLNSCKFWNKPFLCIINRCFLTSKKKYEKIKVNIDLVIHDECHTIENNTTQLFYKWLEKNKKSKIIGFSATPELIYPLHKIITKYSIYDAFKDKVILPPKILWIKSEKLPKTKNLIKIIKKEIDKLPYKKIIIWSGIISECIETANEWRNYFENYSICLDFNNMDKNKYKDFEDYDYFYNTKKNSLLFCAVKHREGSDIPNIDACIFLDMVEKRSERVFTQCIGRVLRKDKENNKKYGLVIDLKARSAIEICNRIQYYLELENIFPWKYNIKRKIIKDKSYFINTLKMIEKTDNNIDIEEKNYSRQDIIDYFIREIPNDKKYKERLNKELDLILEKNLFGNLLKAVEILELTKNIPHITRGSCGSSLVCYLLGISHTDPVKNSITFARFLNKYRDNLPDIDFDFPHYLRDEVFLKLFQKWGNKVARISNHNYYHEKSALRQSLRNNGIRKFISKYELQNEINKLSNILQKQIYKNKKELEGKFRGFSLHCGGIIYYPEGIPEDKILGSSKKNILRQVILNREEVSKNKNFKIDILSSRGLTQLYYCNNFNKINFDLHLGDQKTIDLLSSGNNIGITLAETPLMRKALLLIKPTTINELAICLAIIRPAAKNSRKEFELGNYHKNNVIFDDDVINIIKKTIQCEEDYADKIRRDYSKTNKINPNKIVNPVTRKKLEKILNNLKKYGFCKAHAISYAQLVWQLAYFKANNSKKFWESTLKNIDTCYRKWVHYYEASCHNVSYETKINNKSIYAKNRNKKFVEEKDMFKQLQNYGYWNIINNQFYPNCYLNDENNYITFKGLIAASRIINYNNDRKLILFIGVEKQKYIEVIVKGNFYYNNKKVIVEGRGIKKNKLYNTIECDSENIRFI